MFEQLGYFVGGSDEAPIIFHRPTPTHLRLIVRKDGPGFDPGPDSVRRVAECSSLEDAERLVWALNMCERLRKITMLEAMQRCEDM